MNDNSHIPLQAFLQEIMNWELTLSRQAKKLKQLRKVSSNKFQINSIDIILIEIQSELIQFKKIKDKKYLDSQYVIEDYAHLSKKFMNIMEKIGESADQDRYKDTLILDVHTEKSQQNQPTNKNKHFLEETFTYKVSKEPSKKKNKSCIETKKHISSLLKQKTKPKQQIKGLKDKMWNTKQNTKFASNLNRLQREEEQDLSDVRYQLKQIKSMMLQIENQIKYHNHQDLQKQIGKMIHNNKKIALEVKNVREDNQFILARLQNIKDQINHQRKVQSEMIKQFEAGKDSKTQINELSKSKNQIEEISEWVKVRI